MPTVWIPVLLRPLTNNQETVAVAGSTLRQVIESLEKEFPGITARICDGDRIRPGLAVVIDTQVHRGGLDEPVPETSEVHFVPGISGGEW